MVRSRYLGVGRPAAEVSPCKPGLGCMIRNCLVFVTQIHEIRALPRRPASKKPPATSPTTAPTTAPTTSPTTAPTTAAVKSPKSAANPRSEAAPGRSAGSTAAEVWLTAAHDLRQPLQSLALTSRLLTLDCTEGERRAAVENLGLVLASLDQMVAGVIELAGLASGARRLRTDGHDRQLPPSFPSTACAPPPCGIGDSRPQH